jgi:hypothetical protein
LDLFHSLSLHQSGNTMIDVLLIVLGAGGIMLMAAYALGCERI